MKPDANDLTRKEILSVPTRRWDEEIGEFDALVLVPRRTRHDSGFGTMDFVALRGNTPIARLSGHSDVLHINGISGFGQLTKDCYPDFIRPVRWSIDLLWRSQLFRLFSEKPLTVGAALSSFEVFTPTTQYGRRLPDYASLLSNLPESR